MKAAAAEVRDTRRAVLDCAARLFRTQGYAAVSLRDIASAMGMKAGSLYYHFNSKEEIVIEILNLGVHEVHEEVSRSVAALPSDAPSQTVFETAISAHLRSLLELQDYTSANTRIYGQVPSHVRAATMEMREAYEGLWTDILDRLLKAGAFRADVDLHLLRLFLIGAMNSALEWYQPKKKQSVKEIAGVLSRTIFSGVAATNDRQSPKASNAE